MSYTCIKCLSDTDNDCDVCDDCSSEHIEQEALTEEKPKKAKREPKPTFDAEYIRDLSERVYRLTLVRDNGEGSPDRMIASDKDGGQKLRNRAGAYDPLTRIYLKVLGFEPPALPQEGGER